MWNPAEQIIDTRYLGRNILSFVSANQTEALNWANDGTDLKPFKQFSESVINRAEPIFPSLAILSERNATDFAGDIIASAFEITFEAMITGTVPADLPLLAKKYKHALESMLLNIPAASILMNAQTVTSFRVDSIETDFDEIKTNDMRNSFMQMFQTKVVYVLYTGAY